MTSTRQRDTSAAHTTTQILKSLVIVAAIAMATPQAAFAGTLFGNVTADLFAPTVTLPSVPDVDAEAATEVATDPVLDAEAGPAATTTRPEEPPLRPRSQPGRVSQRPRIDARLDVADLRNRRRGRPRALLPLYATFGVLQMLDAHSTTRALQNGGVEANPVVASLVGNTGALYATKLAVAGVTVYAAEKLWRKNRVAAILTMVAINSAYSVIVRHNYGIAGR